MDGRMYVQKDMQNLLPPSGHDYCQYGGKAVKIIFSGS